MKQHSPWLYLFPMACMLMAGCSKPSVKGELSVKGGAVSDVRIIIGTDKLHWPHLDDGESRRFQTAAALPAELTVLYSFDNQERYSRGPDIMASGRVQITIEPSAHQPDRAVTYQVLPSGQ